MKTNSIEHWKENAENGILHGKAGYVLKSSKELVNLGKQDEAEVILKSALQRGSWDELSEIKMLTSLSKLIMEKDPTEVIQLIDASKRRDPGLVLMKATALGNLNRTVEAITLLENEVETNPNLKYEPDIASKLSILYRQVGNDQKTVNFLAPLVEEGYFKDHLLIKQILADAYIRTRKADKALLLLEGQQDRRSMEMIDRARRDLGRSMPSEEFKIETETKPKYIPNSIFIVHGHDDHLKQSAARFLEKLEMKPVILHEQADKGRTIIEKFEDHASDVTFAVVLLTPDDIGGLKSEPNNLSPRARQNVIFEMGYFVGKLGRGKVCALYQGVEEPSDLRGVLYIPVDENGAWQYILAREIKASGLDVDLNKAM